MIEVCHTGPCAMCGGENIADYLESKLNIKTGETTPDGVTKFTIDEQIIARRLRDLATSRGWPGRELDDMLAARRDGLAALWARLGTPNEVMVSPDTGPFGGRAQRVEVTAVPEGRWIRPERRGVVPGATRPRNCSTSSTGPYDHTRRPSRPTMAAADACARRIRLSSSTKSAASRRALLLAVSSLNAIPNQVCTRLLFPKRP